MLHAISVPVRNRIWVVAKNRRPTIPFISVSLLKPLRLLTPLHDYPGPLIKPLLVPIIWAFNQYPSQSRLSVSGSIRSIPNTSGPKRHRCCNLVATLTFTYSLGPWSWKSCCSLHLILMARGSLRNARVERIHQHSNYTHFTSLQYRPLFVEGCLLPLDGQGLFILFLRSVKRYLWNASVRWQHCIDLGNEKGKSPPYR